MWLPDQGLNLHTLHWEEEVLTTGSPGKTLKLLFLAAVFFCFVSILFHIKLHLFISYVDSVPRILTIRLIVILAKNYRKLQSITLNVLISHHPEFAIINFLLEKERATMPAFLPGESHGQRSLVGYSP